MNNTTKIAATITSLIGGSVLALTPLDAGAQMPTDANLACPGLTVDSTCFVPGSATTSQSASTATLGVVAAANGVPAVPVVLSFDKTAVDPNNPGVWVGTIDGDITGTLETRLTDRRVAGPIWHVSFDWIITAGDQSFVAELRGTLNNNTGAVVMNGTVVEGYLLGARVHEEGQLVDAETLQFQGSIQLMPATATAPSSR